MNLVRVLKGVRNTVSNIGFALSANFNFSRTVRLNRVGAIGDEVCWAECVAGGQAIRRRWKIHSSARWQEDTGVGSANRRYNLNVKGVEVWMSGAQVVLIDVRVEGREENSLRTSAQGDALQIPVGRGLGVRRKNAGGRNQRKEQAEQ